MDMTYLEALAQLWSVLLYLDHMAQRQRTDERRAEYLAAFCLVRDVHSRMHKDWPGY
jgi:hypothetical protein